MYPLIVTILMLVYLNFSDYNNYKEFIYNKFKTAKESEKQWHLSLKSIPNGLMIYNIQDD